MRGKLGADGQCGAERCNGDQMVSLFCGFRVSKGLFINVDIFSLAYLHIAQKPAYNMEMICMHLAC